MQDGKIHKKVPEILCNREKTEVFTEKLLTAEMGCGMLNMLGRLRRMAARCAFRAKNLLKK